MANGPPGDIELLFIAYDTAEKLEDDNALRSAHLRIRLYRRIRSLEISRRISSGSLQGSEWTKRVVQTATDFTLSCDDFDTLAKEEQIAMPFVYKFLGICEASEISKNRDILPEVPHVNPASEDTKIRKQKENIGLGRPRFPSTTSRTVTSSSATRVFSNVDLLPRPRKFSDVTSTYRNSSPSMSNSNTSVEVIQGTLHSLKLDTSDFPLPQGLDSRFIADLGWCVRTSSRISQGGRYQIMYIDGSTSEIDADEEWICHVDAEEMVSRYVLRNFFQHEIVILGIRAGILFGGLLLIPSSWSNWAFLNDF